MKRASGAGDRLACRAGYGVCRMQSQCERCGMSPTPGDLQDTGGRLLCKPCRFALQAGTVGAPWASAAAAKSTNLADFSARLTARVLDLGLMMVSGATVFLLLALFGVPLLTRLGIWLAVLGIATYALIADGLHGASPAKQWLGLAVVDTRSGAPCGLIQSVLRNVSLVIGPIDWLFAFGGKGRQRLGDLLAHTVVVRSPALSENRDAPV